MRIDDRATAALLFVALLACTAPADAGNGQHLQQLAAQRRDRCEAISADRYQTGLIFNPEHLETTYDRSSCFQALAEELRDPRLCRLARERKSWFFDGSGISPQVCAASVARRIRLDKAKAARMQPPQRLAGLVLYRDGNGRDIDVHLRMSGGAAGRYWLRISATGPDGNERTLRQDWQPMDSTDGELRLLVKFDSVQRIAGPDQELSLRVTLERRPKDLDDQAILAHLPPGSQRSSLQRRFALSTLEREPPVPVRHGTSGHTDAQPEIQ